MPALALEWIMTTNCRCSIAALLAALSIASPSALADDMSDGVERRQAVDGVTVYTVHEEPIAETGAAAADDQRQHHGEVGDRSQAPAMGTISARPRTALYGLHQNVRRPAISPSDGWPFRFFRDKSDGRPPAPDASSGMTVRDECVNSH